jgi:hypothetical protein
VSVERRYCTVQCNKVHHGTTSWSSSTDQYHHIRETMAQQTNHLFDRAEVSFVHEGPTTLHVQQGGLVRLHVVINQTHASYSSI